MHRAEVLLWPEGKTKLIRPDGSIGNAPGHGVVLIGMGEKSCRALEHSGLGLFCRGLIRSECRADERRARAMMGAMLDQERRKVSARLKSPNSIMRDQRCHSPERQAQDRRSRPRAAA